MVLNYHADADGDPLAWVKMTPGFSSSVSSSSGYGGAGQAFWHAVVTNGLGGQLREICRASALGTTVSIDMPVTVRSGLSAGSICSRQRSSVDVQTAEICGEFCLPTWGEMSQIR
jgi:hypothetical protein